jgi:hypothetical protein
VSLGEQDLEPFNGRRNGPVRVARQDGTFVCYASWATLRAREDRHGSLSLSDLELVLLSEMSVAIRDIPGDHLVDVAAHNFGWTFTVSDDEIPESGPTVGTRGFD